MAVGKSHHDSAPTRVETGPRQQMFFAPTEVSRRIEEWGRDVFAERTKEALGSFVEGSAAWMSIEQTYGAEAAEQTWTDVREGHVPANIGRVVSMHPAG